MNTYEWEVKTLAALACLPCHNEKGCEECPVIKLKNELLSYEANKAVKEVING